MQAAHRQAHEQQDRSEDPGPGCADDQARGRIETGAWLGALAWLTASGAGWLRRAAVPRWLDRLSGLALIGIGLRLAEAR